MAKKEKNEYEIRSVSRALTLLEQFQDTEGELRITDLSRLLQTNKNYILRLLATLESYGYVEKNDQTGGYRLGVKNLFLGRAWIGNKRLVAEGRKTLEQLSALTGETVHLSVLQGETVTYADVLESTFPVRVVTVPGTSLPLHASAAGKLMLAHNGQKFGGYLQTGSLRKYSERTIISPIQLIRHLEEVRTKGYALDLEESETGLCGAAAPIRDFSSRVVAAVSIVGPGFRLEPEKLCGEIAQLVVGAAHEISRLLGYRRLVELSVPVAVHNHPHQEVIRRYRKETAKEASTVGAGGLTLGRFTRQAEVEAKVPPPRKIVGALR